MDRADNREQVASAWHEGTVLGASYGSRPNVLSWVPPGLESRQETANDCLGCSFSADEIHTRNLLGLPPGELEAAYYVRHPERHREQSPPRERRERTPVRERR